MVTLLPALLVICGRWIFWPKRPTFGSPEPTSTGFWARVGPTDRPAPAHGLGDHHRPPARSPAWACSARHHRSLDRGAVHQGVRLDQGPAGAGRARPRRHVQPDPGRRQRRPGCRRSPRPLAGVDGLGEPSEPVDPGRRRVHHRRPSPVTPRRQAAFDIVEAARDAVHEVDGADALVGGCSAIYLDTKIASNRDNKVIIPIVLLVVLLILMVLLRALDRAADPDRDGDPVVRGRAGSLGAAVRVRLPSICRVASGPRPTRLPAVRVRVPRRAGHRLQHLPDDPGARGDRNARAPGAGSLVALTLDRRRDHLGRPRAGGDVPRARHPAAGVPRPARHRRGARRHARHDDRPVGAGHRDQPRPRQQDLVAEQARPWTQHGRGDQSPERETAGV